MSSISLVTPVSWRDMELCALQCESVDRYLTCYVKHHLIVPDDEVALFDRFNAARRVVVPASQILPPWLRPMPRFLQHKGPHYWWSLRTRPVSHSHLQRILKIAAADAFPESRHCILEPEVVFFRRFDLSMLLRPRQAPLFEQAGDTDSADLVQRARTSRYLLGLKKSSFPATDFSTRIAAAPSFSPTSGITRSARSSNTNLTSAASKASAPRSTSTRSTRRSRRPTRSRDRARRTRPWRRGAPGRTSSRGPGGPARR